MNSKIAPKKRRGKISSLAILFLVAGNASDSLFQTTIAQEVGISDRQKQTTEFRPQRGTSKATAYANQAVTHLLKARKVGDWTELDSARSYLARARLIDADDAEVLWCGANVFLYQHHFREMLEVAGRMVELYPNDPRGYGSAGDALFELGRLDAARKSYHSMLALRRDFHSLNRLARITNALGDRDAALELMREAISKTGEDSAISRHWAMVMMASFEMERGQLERAEKILLEVISENPKDDFALEHLGEIYWLLKRDKDADKMYERAFSIRPYPVYAIAWAQVKRHLSQAALADTLDRIAERALQQHVEAGRVAYFRDLTKFYLLKRKKAKVALQLAVQDTVVRQDTDAFVTLAWALRENGRNENAWGMINKAVAQPSADAMTFYQAGVIRAKLGDRRQARQLMQKALDLNPFFGRPQTDAANVFLGKR